MDEQSSKFLKSFIVESTDLLDKAEEAILSLEQGFDQEKVDQLFRAIHTIKGNSGLFDLNRIKELSHIFENVLSAVRSREIEPDVDMVDIFLLSVDRLRQMIDRIEDSEKTVVEDLVSRLSSLRGSAKSEERKTPADVQPDVRSVFENFCKKLRTKIPPAAMQTEDYLACAVMDLAAQNTGKLSEISARLQTFRKGKTIILHGISPSLVSEFNDKAGKTLPYFIVFQSKEEPNQALTAAGLQTIALDLIHAPVKTGEAEVNTLEPEKPAAVETPAPKAKAIQPAQVEKREEDATGVEKESHLKVPLPLIENLINLASETVIARNELMQKVETSSDPTLAVSAKKISYLVSRIQEGIMRTRLQELETLFQRVPRLVRDVCSQTGKQVQLITDGGNVELDKTLIDSIRDPLTHIVRNAIDHGIEAPDERIRLGKPREGKLRVDAFFRGGNVIITVQDDGRGLNYDRIREKAQQRGLLSAEAAKAATDAELADLIFLPGFSTSETVTTTSGRGVGMDVVRTSLKKAGGSAEINSVSGVGTTIQLTIPQTLSIVTCILIKSGGTRLAIPQANVKELLQLDPTKLDQIQDSLAYEIRGHLLPLIHLQSLLRTVKGEDVRETRDSLTTGFIIVVETEQHRFGLLVDEILNPEEIVVKSLGQEFAEVKIFSGAAIMGDGEAVLILDTAGIARHRNMQGNLSEDEEEEQRGSTVLEGMEESGYLVFESSSYYFGVPVSSVPRIEQIEYNRIETLLDFEILNHQNHIVPLLRLEKVFALDKKVEMFNQKETYVILFTINGFRIGLIADEVHNVVTDFEGVDRNTFTSESVTAYALTGGKTTMLLDIEDLAERFKNGRYRALKEHLSESLEGKTTSGVRK